MTSSPTRAAVAAAAALLPLAGCGGSSTSTSSPPAVVISQPAPGVHVKGNVVALAMSLAGGDGASSSTTSAARFAVYADHGPPGVGASSTYGAPDVQATASPIDLVGFTVGRHTLTVVAVDASGRRTDATPATLTITVDGPSVTATAPASVPSGTPVPVTLSTFGVTIVDLKTDTTGRTAHYDLFIDSPPPEAGTAVALGPAVVRTTDSLVKVPLAAGRHTIGVVLADGAERVLNPLVAARVTVTVGGQA